MASMMSTCSDYAFEDGAELDMIELSEIDAALLMQLLLEEPRPEEAEDDRLGSVIQSLEAELGCGPANPSIVGGDGIVEQDPIDFEDMVLDFDGYDCSTHRAGEEQLFDWVEMEIAGAEMGDWYVEDEMVGDGGLRCYPSFYYNGETSSIEQVYSPLWE